jgi:hypothetical protein
MEFTCGFAKGKDYVGRRATLARPRYTDQIELWKRQGNTINTPRLSNSSRYLEALSGNWTLENLFILSAVTNKDNND